MKLYRILVPVRDIDAGSTFYGAVFEAPGERVGLRHRPVGQPHRLRGDRHEFTGGRFVR